MATAQESEDRRLAEKVQQAAAEIAALGLDITQFDNVRHRLDEWRVAIEAMDTAMSVLPLALIEQGWTPPGQRPPSPEAYLPCEMRWRFVHAGDVFVLEGELFTVMDCGEYGDAERWGASVLHAGEEEAGEVDPDATVSVLLPAVQASAIVKARTELGGQMIARGKR